MTFASKLLQIGRYPPIHAITRGRLWPYVREWHKKIPGRTITTKDGFRIMTDDNDSLGLRLNREYEPQVRAVMREIIRPSDVVVDVGANIGYHSVLMASLGARVIAIEPIAETRDLLRKNFNLNHVCPEMIIPAAVSDYNGSAQISLHPQNNGMHSLEVCAGDRSIDVPVIRLDDILPPGPIRLIKIDIEGHEAAAIRGLGDRLDGVDYIIYEHWGDHRVTPDPAEYLKGWDIRVLHHHNYIASRTTRSFPMDQ